METQGREPVRARIAAMLTGADSAAAPAPPAPDVAVDGLPHVATPPRRTLARRYALLLCGVTLMLLVVSGLSEASFGYREARAHIAELQSVQAEGAAKEIAGYLSAIEVGLRDVAKMPWGSAGFGPAQRREEFYRLMQLAPAIIDLQVVDAQARERLSVSRREDDRSETLRPFEEPGLLPVSAAVPLRYGRTFHREDLSPMMRMAVFDGSSAIVATVDLRLLGEVVSRLRIGKQGAAYIVDASDVLIAHPHATEVLRRPDLRIFDAVRRARAAHWSQDATLALSDTQDLQGRPVIATAARIEAPDWLLIVEQPRAEALHPVLEALARTGLLVALGGVAAVIAGVLFARRMAAPIVTLRRATARIAGGDLSSPIEVHSRDEIEDLAHDFNLMAARLRESYAGLEAKVVQRTIQLSEARDKLALRAAEVDSLNERLVDQLGQLAARRDEAERASAAKTRFLATASHDLRQPMHSISLLVGVLHDRTVDPEARAIAAKVQASVSTMEGLFGSLLDISKLDAGAVRPEITEFPLAALFARVEQVWAPQAVERGLRLVVRPTRLLVRSDEALLERVVGNLVSNAIGYTQRGRVVLAARRRGDQCLLQVLDTGPGIPPQYRETIFEEFFRIDAPGTGVAKGLGLGLSIVQRGAHILGHGLRVDSRVGAGTLFEVALPCSLAQDVRGEEAGGPRRGSEAMAGTFVVVVDDDEGNRQALASVLLSWGCHVLAAASTDEALALAHDHLRVPDLLVTDYQLAGADNGLQLAQRLREHYEERIPVLVVTANTDGDLATRAAAIGARVLHKPTGAARLLAAALEAMPQGAPA